MAPAKATLPQAVVKPKPFATKEARLKLFGGGSAPASPAGGTRPTSPFGSPDHELPSNHGSQGKYGKRFDRVARTFDEAGIAARAERRKRAQLRFKMVFDLVGAVQAFKPSTAAVAKEREALEGFATAGRRSLRLPDIPEPALRTPRSRLRNSVICEVCNEPTCDDGGHELEPRLLCGYCPNVAHARCVAAAGLDWGDAEKPGARRCCHICSGNLRDAVALRLKAFDDARSDYRTGMANDILTRAVRAWLSAKRFQERKRRVIKAQSVVRRYLCRSKFRLQRGLFKRAIAVRLQDVVVSSLEPPPERSLHAILSVLDHTQRLTLFSFDIDECPLAPKRAPDRATPKARRRASNAGGRRQTTADAQAELEEARELKRLRAKTPFATSRAAFHVENVLPGSTYDVTIGAHHIRGTPEDLQRFDGSRGAREWLAVELKPHMRYPLRDQSREEMRAMVAGVYRGYVKAELKVQVEGLNSLYNMCTWLEAPHFETLKKSEGAASAASSKGGRKQLWWAMLCNGMFQLYTSQGDVQARVSLLAHRAVVDYERLAKSHGFAMTLPDRRTWSFAPLSKHEAGNWIFGFEYWRLKHAHGHAAALGLLCAPTPKHDGRGHHGHHGHGHHGKRMSAAEHRRRSLAGAGPSARSMVQAGDGDAAPADQARLSLGALSAVAAAIVPGGGGSRRGSTASLSRL
ncbi:hypothetical protein JL722_2896 [Aureococcus anophagefferens]|nr:hypothetical protein JL722_2896 [Aureococcus anophagefferens]